MVKSAELMLPIPGYQKNSFKFFAHHFAKTVDTKVDDHVKLQETTGIPIFTFENYTTDANKAGRKLVPVEVMHDMRYTAMVHGYGATEEDMSQSNALWDEVIANLSERPSHVIDRIDGPLAGYRLSCSSYDISQKALVRVLELDQITGEEYRRCDWMVNYTLDDEGDM